MNSMANGGRVLPCPPRSNRALQSLWLLLSLASLIPALDSTALAQYVQGQPVVGNATNNGPAASGATIDATLFSPGDMCAKIALACQSANTPVPTTIDARGFTGAQVCAPASVTIMLNSCAGNGGGKLLLGNVNVYADGPTTGATGNYSDAHSSGIGTPAFLLPSEFWGIEGASRGAGGLATTFGTFLSICIGSNNPVGSGHIAPGPGSGHCNQAFPQRTFGITSITGTPPTMTINLNATLGLGPSRDVSAEALME
jgi:hypothetical protein